MGDVTTSSTLATANASAPSMGATTIGAPRCRTVDVLRRRSSNRTTRVVNSDDASAAGSSTVSDGRPGSDASFVRENASALAEPVAFTAQSSHAVSRSRCSCRSIHQTAGWRPANATITRWTSRAISSRRWTCAHSCDDDLIELLIVQRAEGDRCDDDGGRRQAEHGCGPNVVRDRQPGATTPCPEREPCLRAALRARRGTVEPSAWRRAERQERGKRAREGRCRPRAPDDTSSAPVHAGRGGRTRLPAAGFQLLPSASTDSSRPAELPAEARISRKATRTLPAGSRSVNAGSWELAAGS